MRLFSRNAKTEKSKGDGALILPLQLSPATESVPFGGKNTCPEASSCTKACLKFAGMNNMPTHENVRVRRTLLYFDDPEEFHRLINKELAALRRKADKAGMTAAARPNTLSDLPRLGIRTANENPDMEIYDYTKRLKFWKKHGHERPDNYTVVLSRSETNEDLWNELMNTGEWAGAVVFDTDDPANFPTHYMGHPVENGDASDSRWKTPKGTVVGLTLKGTNKAKQEARDSGFAVPC